jgi:hypothetical protein
MMGFSTSRCAIVILSVTVIGKLVLRFQILASRLVMLDLGIEMMNDHGLLIQLFIKGLQVIKGQIHSVDITMAVAHRQARK